MSRPVAVVFDHTALGALGAGRTQLSRMVAQAHAESGRYVFTPALCLSAAVAERPALAEHVGVLPAVRVVELDYPAAASVGGFIAAGMDWRAAHAVDVGRPTAEWPAGRSVVTTRPEAYDGWGVEVVPVGSG